MSKRRYVDHDPTSSKAIGNVTRENKMRRRQKSRRRIVDEYPDIFAGLTRADAESVTLMAARAAGYDAWAIDAGHLEQAKATYLGSR